MTNNKIKLVVVIVERGMGEQVCSLLRKSHVSFNMISPGYGASGSNIKDYLGITSSEKDIVLSVVNDEQIISIMDKLLGKFNMDQPGNGIAFAIPISGVSGPLALRYMAGIWDDE